MRLRPAVQWFAEQMEQQLRANDRKGGWSRETWRWLLDRLLDEAHELEAACLSGEGASIIREAGDLANFAMMIADNAIRDERKVRGAR